MKIDLAAMVRRACKTRQPYVVGRAIIPTQAQEQSLLNIYMRVVRGWLAEWTDRIRPEYERTLQQMPAIGDSVDSTEEDLNDAAAAMTRLTVTLTANLEDWIVRVETWHRRQFAQSFAPTGIRLDTLLGREDVSVTLQSVLAENVSLIRSLDDQMRNGISGAVFRGLTNRTPAREVAREIRKAAGIGQRRAELIASDQLQKLTGRLDQERQQQVGSTEFEWMHSHKRYPRPEHVARDGKRYKWSSVIGKTDPPGRAIRCGCRARPVINIDALLAEET